MTPQIAPTEAFPNLPGVASCGNVPLLSLQQLSEGQLASQRVAVEGIPQASVTCTALFCGDRRCCNSCGGAYQLRGTSPSHFVELAGLEGCTGNDCDLVCRPLGRAPTRRYRFVGVHRYETDTQRSVIEVETVCRLFSVEGDFGDDEIDRRFCHPDGAQASESIR